MGLPCGRQVVSDTLPRINVCPNRLSPLPKRNLEGRACKKESASETEAAPRISVAKKAVSGSKSRTDMSPRRGLRSPHVGYTSRLLRIAGHDVSQRLSACANARYSLTAYAPLSLSQRTACVHTGTVQSHCLGEVMSPRPSVLVLPE